MLNFFDAAYQEPPRNDSQFGLCDNGDGTAAFTDAVQGNSNNWIATVENPQRNTLIFTVIDNGVINGIDYEGYARCDGMLTSDNHLYFVELKDQKDDWLSKAISQLESTIKLFDETHPGKKNQFKHKKAFICNKKYPYFHVFDNDRALCFFRNYQFRLDIQAKILVG